MQAKLIIDNRSYKVGVDEIGGLKQVLIYLLKPVQAVLKDKVYWNDCEIEDSEYKSRDGFIAHTHNCGGPQIRLVVPKCEEYSFPFLTFGEHDDECCSVDSGECTTEGEGHLDASLRVWLKFEGLDQETGEMSFYLYMGGGNGDAPYFRTKHEATIFEREFKAKTLAQVKREGVKAVNALLKVMKG